MHLQPERFGIALESGHSVELLPVRIHVLHVENVVVDHVRHRF